MAQNAGIMDEEHIKKIRRKIEDYLRKDATPMLILKIAQLLKII
jgi:hypothetical protein